MDKIKQQKNELDKHERNSTNNKNNNDRLNMILSVIDRIYKFFEYKVLSDKQSVELKLPKWVNVSKERFNNILSTISKAKNDGLKTNVDGREITLDNAESLLKGAASRKINGSHFQKEYNNIVDDVEIILQKSMFTRSQNRMVEVLSLLGEITKLKDKKIDEQPDTTDMPELESEEPAGQKSSELVVNYQFF